MKKNNIWKIELLIVVAVTLIISSATFAAVRIGSLEAESTNKSIDCKVQEYANKVIIECPRGR